MSSVIMMQKDGVPAFKSVVYEKFKIYNAFPYGNFDTVKTWEPNNCKFSVTNNEATLERTGTYSRIVNTNFPKPSETGHSYLLKFYAKSIDNNTNNVTIVKNNGGVADIRGALSNEYKLYTYFYPKTSDKKPQYFLDTETATVSNTRMIKQIEYIDLTKTFGEGNEPSTIDDLYKTDMGRYILSKDYIPYNANGVGVSYESLVKVKEG